MKKVIILDKKEGQSPLEALELFRSKNKEYQNSKMTYAGRLDPMASGLLLILVDEKIKEKEEFLSLNKEYYFEVLFGFASDTYDILGEVGDVSFSDIKKRELRSEIKEKLKNFNGKIYQKYPPFSSKTVKGKPLFAYARSGEKVERPKRLVEIKKLKLLKIRKINGKELLKEIKERIDTVNGDFRQEEIKLVWENVILEDRDYFLANLKIKCSTGAYVRDIANSLGEELGTLALAYRIKRTKIGKYKKNFIKRKMV